MRKPWFFVTAKWAIKQRRITKQPLSKLGKRLFALKGCEI